MSNKYATNPYTPEPLGVFSFSQTDTEPLLMAAYQAYFEDKCSLEFSKQIIKLAKQANEKQMQDILSSVEEEVKKADENLRLIQGYLNSCLDVNNSFNSIQQNLVKVQVASKYEHLS